MKQTRADIQPNFADDTKICQIETTQAILLFYTVIVYMYMCIGLVNHVSFAFAGNRIQAYPRGWKKPRLFLDLLLI